MRLGDRLIAVPAAGADGGWEVRTLDGATLSRGSTRWREGAHRFSPALPPTAGDTLHADLAVTGWACPKTGALLGIDVHLNDEEPCHDIELDLASLAVLATTNGAG